MQSLIRTTTATATLVVVALALTAPGAASAAPDPDCAALSENLRRLCESTSGAERVWTEEANKNSSLGDSLSSWVSDNAGLLVFGFLAVMGAWIAIALMRENAEEKAERAAAEAARGRALAAADQARRQAEAEAAALAQAPARETFDPLGLGLPAPAVQVPAVAAPPTNPEDLARYAALGAVVPWTPGTALATVMTRAGSIAPARRAFAEACELGGLGETDAESGAFTPAASVVRVETTADEGDAALVIRPASVLVGGEQIDRIRTLLERTARVRHAGPAARIHATGEWIVVLSNRDLTALEQQTSESAVAVDSDDEDW
ncbi:hypothetical protein [Tsukamurella paurometabola]|uniref:Uncharacterized protein n=1 Tax=Tsukamurella paurometabola TaxID=2061 RepID=A0ABS5NF87_TSUPA|nr:hypothetical protein [Tsukamurella paurometabola]MBS4102932.1 hypothetical protein [Tsukamurella paurometabola]